MRNDSMPETRDTAANRDEAWSSHVRVQEHVGRMAGRLAREERDRVSVLDVGSGRHGAGRVHLQQAYRNGGATVMLYDPLETVVPSSMRNVLVLDDAAFRRLRAEDVDWINLSYVLSHSKEPREAIALITGLTERFPRAHVSVTEYTLLSRARVDALEVLTQSNAERAEREAFGNDDAFVGMHSRYSRYALEKIFTNVAYMKVTESAHVDRSNGRAFVSARPL